MVGSYFIPRSICSWIPKPKFPEANQWQKRFWYQYYCEPKTTCGVNELYFNMVKESLLKSLQKSQKMGSISNNYGDVNEKGKKAVGTIDWQNKNTAHASPFLLFLCRHCTTTAQKFLISHFVEDMNTRQDFLLFFPELWHSRLEFNSRKKLSTFDELNKMEWAHWSWLKQPEFFSDVFAAVNVVVA